MSQIQTPDPALVKQIKETLSQAGVFSRHPKIHKQNGLFCIYASSDRHATAALLPYAVQIRPHSAEAAAEPGLAETVVSFLGEHGVAVTPGMAAGLPRKWSLYAPMVLFNASTFEGPEWDSIFRGPLGTQLCRTILRFPEFRLCTHLAINKPIIEEDIMRRPFNIQPLAGDFGPAPNPPRFSSPSELDFREAFFCHVTQNGIRQTWAPMYTMFSRGNIKEKKRLLDSCTNLTGSAVVDLYAGVGYFTLSYLKNGATVFAWEINPWSVEGLCRGLAQNKFKYRLFRRGDEFTPEIYADLRQSGIQAFVFLESNEHAISRLAPIRDHLAISHVNLGLLPSSKPSWPIVHGILCRTQSSTTVHVHENVHVDGFGALKAAVAAEFGQVQHLEKVKTFAPDVWHVVVDVLYAGPAER